LYKAPLTATVFKDFSSCYQHFTSHMSPSSLQPFVYVDSAGVKLVTNVVDEMDAPDGVFALSMAQDGWMEMLTLYEAV
jgi:ABC-type transporter Mla MlaB component